MSEPGEKEGAVARAEAGAFWSDLFFDIDIGYIVVHAFILLILVAIPVLLYFYGSFNSAVAFLFLSVIIAYAGIAVFYYIFRESSMPESWFSGGAAGSSSAPELEDTALSVQKAMAGSEYSQFQFRERLRRILILKIRKRHGLDEMSIIKMNKAELEILLKNAALADFLSKQNVLTGKRGRFRKSNPGEWDNIVHIMDEIRAFG